MPNSANAKTGNVSLPKCVVFDLGKVLVDFDYSIAGRRLAAKAKLTPAQIQKHLDHSPLLYRYETGLMSRQEFFADVSQTAGFEGGVEEFAEFFADIFTEIPMMTQFQAGLRRKGIPTYIFSNTNDLAVEHIRRKFPFFANFDGYIYSFEHGAMKPSAKLYEVLERESKCCGAEIVYLDDRQENVTAGSVRGWQAILHESPQATLTELKALGLPV